MTEPPSPPPPPVPMRPPWQARLAAYLEWDGGSAEPGARQDKTGVPPPLWWQVFSGVASRLHGAVVRVRSGLFVLRLRRRRYLPGMTISVGNLAVGGTGKSPVIVRLAQILREFGARPVVLSRGYGSDLASDDSLALRDGAVLMRPKAASKAGRESRIFRLPDEARMASALVPGLVVVCGRRRYQAAQRFLREHPDLAPTHWLIDDGFQHQQLGRDLDIVLLDALRPFPALLPRGLGREAAPALGRAHLIIFTRCQDLLPMPMDEAEACIFCPGPVIKSKFVTPPPEGTWRSVQGSTLFRTDRHGQVCLVTGIAQPQALAATLRTGFGLHILAELHYPDHAPIDRDSLMQVSRGAQSVLTTAKDYWRDPAIFADLPMPVFIVPLVIEWPEDEMRRVIRRLL